MKKHVLFLIFGIIIGYFTSGANNQNIIQPANATVGGLDSYDLRTDYDFKKAVRYIVEDSCEIVNYGGRLELDCD